MEFLFYHLPPCFLIFASASSPISNFPDKGPNSRRRRILRTKYISKSLKASSSSYPKRKVSSVLSFPSVGASFKEQGGVHQEDFLLFHRKLKLKDPFWKNRRSGKNLEPRSLFRILFSRFPRFDLRNLPSSALNFPSRNRERQAIEISTSNFFCYSLHSPWFLSSLHSFRHLSLRSIFLLFWISSFPVVPSSSFPHPPLSLALLKSLESPKNPIPSPKFSSLFPSQLPSIDSRNSPPNINSLQQFIDFLVAQFLSQRS